jgi:hypothetical protein
MALLLLQWLFVLLTAIFYFVEGSELHYTVLFIAMTSLVLAIRFYAQSRHRFSVLLFLVFVIMFYFFLTK